MDALLKRARAEGTPLIDGDTATFVWEGNNPPRLVGDFNKWTNDPGLLKEITPGIWSYSLALPADAYIEYAYQYTSDKDRLPDPFNVQTTPNGLGFVNHFFYMPKSAPTSLGRHLRGVARGKVTHHKVDCSFLIPGSTRTVHLYQPPTSDPCPLIVVFDGDDYLKRAHLPDIVDNLIAQKRIQPVALAMVANGKSARFAEYACSEATLGFIGRHLLPFAQQNLRLIDPAGGNYGVLGASAGGLISLYAGLRLPDLFGRVLSQSGAFAGIDRHKPIVFDMIKYNPLQPLKIWMDCGKYEYLLDSNRDMHDVLKARGYDVTYREYNGGHNYPAWRDDVEHGLESLWEL